MRTLSLRELNRATLARQLLLERRRLPVVRAVERLAGLQAQWPPSPYIGLWSRLEGFRREALERAVRTGAVVKTTSMRSTLHLISARDYPAYWAALHDIPAWPDAAALVDAKQLAPRFRALVAEGPVSLQQALAYLHAEHGLVEDVHARRVWHAGRIRVHVHHAPETALWTTRLQALYAALPEPEPVERTRAVAHVVRAYLGAFGPATRADVADWSGLRVRDVEPALELLEPLRRFRDEDGRELLDLPRAPLPPVDTPAPVRLLPKWDNLLLAHADRRRVLGEEHRKKIVRGGDVIQTILVDGFVAGTWGVEGGRVRVEPFDTLPRRVHRELDHEVARLEAWLPA